MLEKTNKGEGCFEWRSLRSTGVNRSDTIRAHGNALQACMTGLIPAQPSFLLAPVFPGHMCSPSIHPALFLAACPIHAAASMLVIRYFPHSVFAQWAASDEARCWWPVLISGMD